MKRSDVGKLKKTMVLALCFWAVDAFGDPVRRMWYFDHLASGPEPAPAGQSHHQISIGTVNYADALSNKASALLDLRLIEIEGTFSQNLFLAANAEGSALKAALSSESRCYGVEVARYSATPKGAYGRISGGLLLFPGSTDYWKLGMRTGVMPSAEVPWDFRLSVNFFLSFNHSNDFTLVSLQTSRSYPLGGTRRLMVGGFVTWGAAMRGGPTGENTLISLGPVGAFESGLGKLSLSIPLRVWVDKAVVDASGAIGYLSDFASPSVTLSWQMFL